MQLEPLFPGCVMMKVKSMVVSSRNAVLKDDGVPVVLRGVGRPMAACETCEPNWRPSTRIGVMVSLRMCTS